MRLQLFIMAYAFLMASGYKVYPKQVFIGAMIHTDESGELIVKERSAIFIENGKIIRIDEAPPTSQPLIKRYLKEFPEYKSRILSYGQFMIPGFIDGHIHAVQFPNLGLGYDKTLLDWLETYTYPLETRYTDTNFAERVFDAVVRQTIRAGTTTASYFASLYTEACTVLAEKAAKLGQRAFVGKANMNSPRKDGYYESTEKSIENTIAFVESIEQLKNPLVRPIITPRSALGLDMQLMKRLGQIATARNLTIQSHISETLDQIKVVKKAFPDQPSFAAVYDTAGLLTNKTFLAHGVYLDDSELAILKERGTAIIHCPSSNMNLKSGLCDVQRLKANNIKVGLGTDVSAGDSYSILNEMRSALQVSFFLSVTKDNYTSLSYKDVFHMATLGGAKALSVEDKVGNLVLGKDFDALIIDVNRKNSLLDNFREYTLEENFQRFIYSGDDRNIISVYINGRQVK